MNKRSMETILNFDNEDALSLWSVRWSTSQVQGPSNGRGAGSRRARGRRSMRYGALVLGAFLAMHCRVTANVLTGGYFVFLIFFVVAMALLGNPMRHFEVYLGQWSISGPGRAFRIIPMLDGIGIAICINAIVRAICCCCLSAIAAVYLIHSLSDSQLPYTYCRDFDLKPYAPVVKKINILVLRESRFSLQATMERNTSAAMTTVGMNYINLRNSTVHHGAGTSLQNRRFRSHPKKAIADSILLQTCNETYRGSYPPVYSTPPYNFFFVEVVNYREDFNLQMMNLPLLICLVIIWAAIWSFMILEHILYNRLLWNNTNYWLLVIPLLWSGAILITSSIQLSSMKTVLLRFFHVGSKNFIWVVTDALETALYIHSASTGTELIFGKGLNYYASGHIDPKLNGESIFHSCALLALTAASAAGAGLCAVVDYVQPARDLAFYETHESVIWMIPMYSKCTLVGNYSHFSATLIFGGIMISYAVVAFIFTKSALHTIFEYKVKLVFYEQLVVAALILICMLLSLLVVVIGGVTLLESIDITMNSLVTPLLCALELFCLVFAYRSRDFLSDINVATEEDVCSSRLSLQWQIIPVLAILTLVMKAIVATWAEMPPLSTWLALGPALCTVAAIPARALYNARRYLRTNRST